MPDRAFRAFLDEASALRPADQQEYLVCAALIADAECHDVREHLRPLLLPGQIKFHWTDESERRRADIVARITELGPMSVVVSHLDSRRRRVERYRRKCLESLYLELVSMEVFDLTLESRSGPQDREDRAHIVALQGQGLDRHLRIGHVRGGDEPLLWIADTVLGAINSAYLGRSRHIERLRSTLLIETRTPDSLSPEQAKGPRSSRPAGVLRPSSRPVVTGGRSQGYSGRTVRTRRCGRTRSSDVGSES
ncbi:MAG: hypothetical protein L6367_17965 [Cellulomonas sp.]|nr:hypothetical protein [Cellulomonas sp.]